MRWRNTRDRFGVIAKLLHWLTLLLLIGAFGFGLTMVGMELSPGKLQAYSWHKWIGVTILLIAVVRLAWRLISPPPPLPVTVARYQRVLAGVSHITLYALLIVTPIVGWLMSSALGVPVIYLGLVPLPDFVGPDRALAEILRTAHWALGRLLMAMIAVHILAALYHHFVLKDDVLKRMLLWFKGVESTHG